MTRVKERLATIHLTRYKIILSDRKLNPAGLSHVDDGFAGYEQFGRTKKPPSEFNSNPTDPTSTKGMLLPDVGE